MLELPVVGRSIACSNCAVVQVWELEGLRRHARVPDLESRQFRATTLLHATTHRTCAK